MICNVVFCVVSVVAQALDKPSCTEYQRSPSPAFSGFLLNDPDYIYIYISALHSFVASRCHCSKKGGITDLEYQICVSTVGHYGTDGTYLICALGTIFGVRGTSTPLARPIGKPVPLARSRTRRLNTWTPTVIPSQAGGNQLANMKSKNERSHCPIIEVIPVIFVVISQKPRAAAAGSTIFEEVVIAQPGIKRLSYDFATLGASLEGLTEDLEVMQKKSASQKKDIERRTRPKTTMIPFVSSAGVARSDVWPS